MPTDWDRIQREWYQNKMREQELVEQWGSGPTQEEIRDQVIKRREQLILEWNAKRKLEIDKELDEMLPTNKSKIGMLME